MTYTSIFEKILLLLNLISKSWIYIAFTLITALLISLLLLKKLSKKKCFLLTTLTVVLVLGYTILTNYDNISKLANTLIDNIFLNIYFPSAYAYLFILILINVSTIGSLINPKCEKIYKTVNGICLIITNFVLALILEIISKDNVDVFAKESLFINTNLITLLEFSINIFIIWLISLLAINLINNITAHILIAKENKKLVSNPAVTLNPQLEINEPVSQEEYQSTTTINQPTPTNTIEAIIPEGNKFIPNFTVSVNELEETPNTILPTIETTNPNYDNNVFDLSSFIPKRQEIKPISILNTTPNTSQIFEQILNNELPIIREETKVAPTIEDTKNTYTLNDYRIFNNMLKDIKEHNQSNSITIDKNLEYRLITKYSSEAYNMFKTMLKIYSN